MFSTWITSCGESQNAIVDASEAPQTNNSRHLSCMDEGFLCFVMLLPRHTVDLQTLQTECPFQIRAGQSVSSGLAKRISSLPD